VAVANMASGPVPCVPKYASTPTTIRQMQHRMTPIATGMMTFHESKSIQRMCSNTLFEHNIPPYEFSKLRFL
jgi:hypothetical protein